MAPSVGIAATVVLLAAVALRQCLWVQPEVPPPPAARYLDHLRRTSATISDVPRLQFSQLQEGAFYRELVLRSQPAIIEGWITTGWRRLSTARLSLRRPNGSASAAPPISDAIWTC